MKENTHITNYFKQTSDVVKASIKSAQSEIIDLAKEVSDVMVDDGVVQLFGVNHDIALSMELGFRAGGLVQYHQVGVKDLVLRGFVSKEDSLEEGFLDTPGLAKLFWETYLIEDNDAFMIYVSSEVYGITLELAQLAKEKGHKVFVITSKEAILANRTDNAKALLELADKVVDLNIEYPDLIFDVNGVKVTQIANLVANMFAQAMTMEIYKYLKDNGHQAAVLWSMNILGADDHNKKLCEKFEGRWNS